MIKSRCCKKTVYVYCGNEGISFYVCTCCERACDTISMSNRHGEGYDAGSQTETESVVSAA